MIGRKGEVRPRLYPETLDIVTAGELEHAREKKQLEDEHERVRTRLANQVARLEERASKARRILRTTIDKKQSLERQLAEHEASRTNALNALDGQKNRTRNPPR